MILPASEFCDANTYAENTANLLREAYEQDPTVIPHKLEEMLQKYTWSVLAVFDNQIIWQASIYNSRIPWYTNEDEIGSVLVREWYWNLKIWNSLVERLCESQRYSVAIISATVNPKMYPIFEKNYFRQIEFPPEYLAEGEQYLAPKMKWWIEEFKTRARCYFRKWYRMCFDPRWD